jgi:hypothetical protein
VKLHLLPEEDRFIGVVIGADLPECSMAEPGVSLKGQGPCQGLCAFHNCLGWSLIGLRPQKLVDMTVGEPSVPNQLDQSERYGESERSVGTGPVDRKG